MATLIPAIGSSAFDSTGERRLAERLEQKLDADYLLWHNVPIGPKQTYPDFVVLHARRALLTADDKDYDAGCGDGVPLLKPVSCWRDGQAQIIIKRPNKRDEAAAIADHLASAHQEGFAWVDMAILCPDCSTRDLCDQVLHQRQMPVEMRRSPRRL